MHSSTKDKIIHLLKLLIAPIIIGLVDYTIRQRTFSPEVNIFLAFVAFAAVVVLAGTIFYKQMDDLTWGQLFFRVFTLWLLYVITIERIYLVSHINTDVDFFQMLEVGLIGEVQNHRSGKMVFLFRSHCFVILLATVSSIIYDPKEFNGPSWNVSLFFAWIIIAIILIFI